MKLLILGVCIYFNNEYKYYCQYDNQIIEVCSTDYYIAGDSIFVNLNLIQ